MSIYESKRKYIADTLEIGERLAQLAEECCELSQAALKLRRVIEGKNPSPKTREECEAEFFVELADVLVCLYVTGTLTDISVCDDEIQKNMKYKLKRWAKRLKEEGR